MRKNSLPWHDLFRAAVLGLGLRPQDFWDLTLPEFIHFIPKSISLSRNELSELMAKYPDA